MPPAPERDGLATSPQTGSPAAASTSTAKTPAVSGALPSGGKPSGELPSAVLASGELPSGDTLLNLERQARQAGTGLSAADLDGLWMLERVWPRGRSQPSPLAGPLLRSLGASLRIEAIAPTASGAPASLCLTNSVALGPLRLRFQGPGRLQGKRPLLLFQFDRLELLAGDRLLLSRSLPAPDPRRQPFFALIACGPQRGWLAARGRSGGLAVWRRG